jgi:hypothetical protein
MSGNPRETETIWLGTTPQEAAERVLRREFGEDIRQKAIIASGTRDPKSRNSWGLMICEELSKRGVMFVGDREDGEPKPAREYNRRSGGGLGNDFLNAVQDELQRERGNDCRSSNDRNAPIYEVADAGFNGSLPNGPADTPAIDACLARSLTYGT